ncbi:hypothetical protein BpHYR1_044132 [Brachionus plicatilis]|uniref:Uncharacterized protein n=1 Tax=Brachionus plicatilis TaxID=10195 RepID=A0A3M7RZU7_BRAPC|nr:hypothetical protein BpHYR1_044132 [Brachionus plicatilis]
MGILYKTIFKIVNSGSNSACQSQRKLFTNKVASLWNELPEAVISATSTNAFKDKFDKIRSQQLAANNTTMVE